MSALIERGTLPHGLRVGDELHTEFEMAAITSMGQMFDAEAEADVSKPLMYRAALMAQQLQRVGTFTGPFTLGMMRSLNPADFNALRAAQAALEDRAAELGKPEGSG